MINLAKLGIYRENNRIEAKRAVGGLPHSLWETYSAFANTLGGVILLGVAERKDKTLYPVRLPDAWALLEEFREIVNDKTKVSANVLTSADARVETADGMEIVVINVPRASRRDRPVYIGSTPYGGAYRRNGEGDYRCSEEQVAAMLRDKTALSADMDIVEGADEECLNGESVNAFCGALNINWCGSMRQLLQDCGAVRGNEKGDFVTGAGLLAFGKEEQILSRYQNFKLCYEDADKREVFGGGNVADFYIFSINRLKNYVKRFYEGGEVTRALREALVNAIVNADYRSGGVKITEGESEITFTNHGLFRVNPKKVAEGGVSDPRNAGLIKIFAYFGAGKGAGEGIPLIYKIWRQTGWNIPCISESFSPELSSFTLPFNGLKRAKYAAFGELSQNTERGLLSRVAIELLTDRARCSAEDIAASLGVSAEKCADILNELVLSGAVVREDGVLGAVYMLKS